MFSPTTYQAILPSHVRPSASVVTAAAPLKSRSLAHTYQASWYFHGAPTPAPHVQRRVRSRLRHGVRIRRAVAERRVGCWQLCQPNDASGKGAREWRGRESGKGIAGGVRQRAEPKAKEGASDAERHGGDGARTVAQI